ncbi:hypothetical protein KIW84_024656 [Lathyrus oleraceus]|uniref:Cupin type-1 domain-containing protein n=1 Tax=Pisum sativum TaxID=3888 RepID=A0A9D4YJV0_PEA|nr:hypothetical protein KIW84_024656 [Pisum sativum]
METRKTLSPSPFSTLLIFFLIAISLCEIKALSSEEHSTEKAHRGPVVQRDQRKILFDTEDGEISATNVKDGQNTPHYHLQFFTLEPNSVFLPVLLHAAMVFYVHTGSGKLTWSNEDGTGTMDIHEGDVCSLGEGSVFYIHSNLESQRNKLRIYAMFTNTDESTFDPSIGAYSRVNELVKGFDKNTIQAAFKVPEDLAEAITDNKEAPAIVHAVPVKKHNNVLDLETSFLKYLRGIQSNSKELKTYNIFDNDPDFRDDYGWTSTVTNKQLKQLKHHNIGFFMVNLTMGSMLGPHWNPLATEIAVVLQGEGMVRVVCGSNTDHECENKRFRVKQGDVFVVPRFHVMAQMSFAKGPLVFMGFSTAAKKNHPQFLAGKGSVLQILDKRIVATSLGVSKIAIDKLLDDPVDSIIFGCSSCAEEEERLMEKEREEEEEERREKEEEEKREEEERREKEQEKREQEEKERERRKREEEEEEEERKSEEEEARRQQEERERRREEKEAKREEEARREQEVRREKESRRQHEEEAARREEKARREQEEVRREKEEARKQEQKERKREEEAVREREEAEREQEAARRQKKEEKKREEEAMREREEAEREQEAARRQKKEEKKREEEAMREREEAEREQEAARRQKKEEKKREEEAEAEAREKAREQKEKREAAKREQEKREKKEEEEMEREKERKKEEEEREEEEARREQEKRDRKREEKEARREEVRRKKETTEWEWEEEEEAARRQQEERERKREQDSGSSFEGRRILKMSKSV